MNGVNKECDFCKSTFTAKISELKRGGGKYCSRECYYASRLGKRSTNWRGGRKKNIHGYIEIYRPGHPHADCQGYVKEHILVVTDHIGRGLNKNEVVHHINGNRSDNRITNLLVLDRGDHGRLHNTGAVFTEEHCKKISLSKRGIVMRRNDQGKFLKGASYVR